MFGFLCNVAALWIMLGLVSFVFNAQGAMATTNELLAGIAVTLYAILWKNM